ncbi:RDD family protein [Acinetobacter sp. 194]|uniref:RDD family protein n=1 Tax=Acinetobacter shaoyimingii TaxID=2715164 RepID=UPI00140C8C55|nr:RDD family protein [Acinetobacter shaoyimingii]NHB58368.1 RDD family protein [Acinetobacter shaoyimingii]
MQDIQHPYIAGFWLRFFAAFIDSILVAIVCYVISLCLKNTLITYPILFTCIGFILVAAYFAICNSHFNQGQTFGKQILKIKVVDLNGQYISLYASFVRAVLTYAPICLMTVTLYIDSLVVSIFINFALATIYAFTVYLFVFNRHNRRTVHDYATKTIVIHENVAASPIQTIWKGHFAFLGIILALIVTYFFIQTQVYTGTQQDTLVKLKQLQSNILTTQIASQTIHEDGKTFIMAIYNVQVDDLNLLYNSDFAQRFAENLNQISPETLNENNFILLGVQAGYQFGFANRNEINMYQIERTDQGVEVTEQVSTLNQF